MHARRLVTLLVVAVSAVVLGAPAKAPPINVKAVMDKLSVFRDGDGQYYVVPTPGQWGDDLDEAEQYVFFGDGKSMWQQLVVGYGSEPGSNGQKLSWNLWSPRVKDMRGAELESTPGQLVAVCANDGKDDRKLVPLHADEAKVFFGRAAFLPALWQRQAHLLARDDDGVYYYVDKLREGKDFRVFAGIKGQMKQLPMTNVVQDSGGEIYATKGGQLKIVANANPPGYWVKDGKKTELTMLDPADNRYLVYRELGIYGQLGVPCEDL